MDVASQDFSYVEEEYQQVESQKVEKFILAVVRDLVITSHILLLTARYKPTISWFAFRLGSTFN